MNPRAIGELLATSLSDIPEIASVEIAGPGFLNLRLAPRTIAKWATRVTENLAKSEPEKPLKINVEFVSVNPNGPITVGSGRGAAFGSTLCNVLAAAGHEVHREYYINDGVNSEQMRLFAESVRASAEGKPVPDNGYKGDYVAAVADSLHGASFVEIGEWQAASQTLMLSKQEEDLATFGVTFDTWFSEQSLHNAGKVDAAIAELAASGVADTKPERTKLKLAKGGKIEEVEIEPQKGDVDDEGNAVDTDGQEDTLWLRSTKFADDMDRVLRRRDGRLTYIASDVAYHEDKFNRPTNGDKLITVLGPDHHGYIGRLQAVVAAIKMAKHQADALDSNEPLSETDAKLYKTKEERDQCLAALDLARKQLEVVIFQIVRFVKDGKPAPMRKRDGNIYALIDLIDEIGKDSAPNADEAERRRIGKDVARFFYLMRSHDTHMDFDIDLATKQSDENPVFYVQYAHARICSVIAKAAEVGLTSDPESSDELTHPRELALLKKVLELPDEVRRCAEDYGVHRLATYATELAKAYHHFYDQCRVVQSDQPRLSSARLLLCEAAKTGLKATLDLLGVSAPERMDRVNPLDADVQ
jgi:arginyl-tRNA synthetase